MIIRELGVGTGASFNENVPNFFQLVLITMYTPCLILQAIVNMLLYILDRSIPYNHKLFNFYLFANRLMDQEHEGSFNLLRSTQTKNVF